MPVKHRTAQSTEDAHQTAPMLCNRSSFHWELQYGAGAHFTLICTTLIVEQFLSTAAGGLITNGTWMQSKEGESAQICSCTRRDNCESRCDEKWGVRGGGWARPEGPCAVGQNTETCTTRNGRTVDETSKRCKGVNNSPWRSASCSRSWFIIFARPSSDGARRRRDAAESKGRALRCAACQTSSRGTRPSRTWPSGPCSADSATAARQRSQQAPWGPA